jgi:release factor glutamine methyltransferase
MTLNAFFQECETKSSHLFREFIWILTEKFKLNEAKIISGLQELEEIHITSLKSWTEKKAADYPLQYFIGSTDFMDLNLVVHDGVLIPRSETEEIGYWALDKVKNRKIKKMMDIGTGSGCLGIGVACKLPELELLTLIEPYGDDSLKKNIELHCKDKTFETVHFQDTFEKFKFENDYDLILSNPPYISHGDPTVASGVYEHEPHEALFGGDLGWEKEVAWAERSYEHLSPGGLLVFEFSHDQKTVLEEKLARFAPLMHKDQFDRDRFFSIEKGL